jgi:hypothetical protein
VSSPSDRPPFKPTLAHALGLCGFAVCFAGLMWLEHRWRLSRGDYPGPYLRHTWYWYVTTWVAIVGLAARVFWQLFVWVRR